MNERELREMNSPIRKMILRFNDFKVFNQQLDKNHINLKHKSILEVGCGCGFGLELIHKKFQPKELVAFDFMLSQVELAINYTTKKGIKVKLSQGDATNMELASDSFHAVFVFAVLHHIPKWREAIKEISRVLKDGGVLLIEEPNKSALDPVDHLYHHPDGAKFMWPEFIEGIEGAGLKVLEDKRLYKHGNIACMMCRKVKKV